MAKNNLFLGFARGKVGSVVFYRSKGTQITRALNPSPSNPQSALQMLQRVCLKTSSSAYSLLQDICNHAFEGYAPGTDSQGAFVTRNIQQMRTQLADYINSGDAEQILGCIEANFNGKSDTWPAVRPYIVSGGRAPSLAVEWHYEQEGGMFLGLPCDIPEHPSYDEVINALGLSRGDQLTLLFLSVDDTDITSVYNDFYYARIILEPANGNFASQFIVDGAINSPNTRNRGSVVCRIVETTAAYDICFQPDNVAGVPIDQAAGKLKSMAAAGVIVSRQIGETWQRSNSQLIVRSSTQSEQGHLTWDHETGYLADAIASYLKAGAVSTEYLNQAQRVTTTTE